MSSFQIYARMHFICSNFNKNDKNVCAMNELDNKAVWLHLQLPLEDKIKPTNTNSIVHWLQVIFTNKLIWY